MRASRRAPARSKRGRRRGNTKRTASAPKKASFSLRRESRCTGNARRRLRLRASCPKSTAPWSSCAQFGPCRSSSLLSSLSSPKKCKVQAAARSGQPALRIFLRGEGGEGQRERRQAGGGRRGNTKRTASTPQRSSFLLRDSCDVHGKRYADVVNSHRARPPFKSKLFLSAERRTIYKKSTAPSSSTGTAPPRANT